MTPMMLKLKEQLALSMYRDLGLLQIDQHRRGHRRYEVQPMELRAVSRCRDRQQIRGQPGGESQ
jgi:hypothetical protein